MRPYQNQERGTSASKKNDHSPNLLKMFFFKYMHPKTPKCLLPPELHVNNALSPQTPKTPGGIPVICSSNRSFQLYKLYLFFLSLQTAYSREKKIKEINYCCVLIVSIKQTRGRSPGVVERLRALFLNHPIISPLCLMWVRAPLWPHVRQAKFCLRVCQVVFLGVLPFSPHSLIGPSHMS